MTLIILILLLLLVIVFIRTYKQTELINKNINKEDFWYYPNCMQTAFGGTKCYPYFYPNRFSYPLFPWYYRYKYYYPYS